MSRQQGEGLVRGQRMSLRGGELAAEPPGPLFLLHRLRAGSSLWVAA